MARFICAYCERENVFNPEYGYDALVNLDNAVSNIVWVKDSTGRRFGIVETLDRQTFFVKWEDTYTMGIRLDEPTFYLYNDAVYSFGEALT